MFESCVEQLLLYIVCQGGDGVVVKRLFIAHFNHYTGFRFIQEIPVREGCVGVSYFPGYAEVQNETVFLKNIVEPVEQVGVCSLVTWQ